MSLIFTDSCRIRRFFPLWLRSVIYKRIPCKEVVCGHCVYTWQPRASHYISMNAVSEWIPCSLTDSGGIMLWVRCPWGWFSLTAYTSWRGCRCPFSKVRPICKPSNVLFNWSAANTQWQTVDCMHRFFLRKNNSIILPLRPGDDSPPDDSPDHIYLPQSWS